MKNTIILFLFFISLIAIGLWLYMIPQTDINKDDINNLEKATFAGGCFWCMEAAFEATNGVSESISGYTGGTTENPTYYEVVAGSTGHHEAVQVYYDPNKVSYADLVETFWRQIDPTDNGGQFVDRGSQYVTAIFYSNDTEKEIAEKSKEELEKSNRFDKPIVTKILPVTEFYEADEEHQGYYKKRVLQYKAYEEASGRPDFIKENWADPEKDKLKETLTPLQYNVTQECGTEPAFNNEYWDNKAEGIYVDIVSGEPLFSSEDKFDSGTGWPSFTKPLNSADIIEKTDTALGIERTEVRSKSGDSHLGHVFDDGPGDSGDRYCINSASLKFIPKEDLEKEGYGEYKELFE